MVAAPPAGDPVCLDTPASGHQTGFICSRLPSQMGATGERSEFDITPTLRAPLLTFPKGYLLKYFQQGDTSARQRMYEIRIFPLLGELPKVIEPHLLVYQLYRWQLGPNKRSLPTTKSLDPIIVTAIRVGSPWENIGPASCGIACNCLVPKARTTEESEESNNNQ